MRMSGDNPETCSEKARLKKAANPSTSIHGSVASHLSERGSRSGPKYAPTGKPMNPVSVRRGKK
jgi:hypothetical protein